MYDPIFRAKMPDPYFSGQNFGAPGVDPTSMGWNVNSAYLTPTFMAGYRPNYSGPQNLQSPYMGIGRGLNNAMPTPFQPDTPYYQSPQQYRNNAMYAAQTGTQDAIATGYQFLGGAAVAMAVQGAATSKYLRMSGSNAAWGHVKGFGHAITGGSSSTIAMARATQLPLEAMGRGAGSVMGRAAGGAVSVGINSATRLLGMGSMGVKLGATGAAMGSFAGAAFGTVVAPFALGMAAAEGVNQAVFSPYMYGRQAADTFRESFQGQYTGTGSKYSPLGMGGRTANRLGFEVSRDFINNMSFNGGTGAQVASFGMQAGLYSDIKGGDTGQLRKRTKDIAEQVKVVMQIFNEPSMQDAIKMIGQMATAGGAKGLGDIVKVSQAFKSASALTGTSTQQLMNTVGQQGQFMFGQQGLVPYLGQMSALNAYSGISQAHKSGLISSNALAMMGGREGATQSVMQAQLGMARSPYNSIMAYNQYYNMGTGGGIVGNLSRFGNDVASDPMKAMGRFFATQNMSISDQLNKDPNAFMNQVFQMLDHMPGAKKNGKYSWEAIAMDLQSRGMDANQANALMAKLQAEGQDGYVSNLRGVSDATRRDRLTANLEKEGLLYGGLGEVPRMFKRFGKSIQNKSSQIAEANVDFFGGLAEKAENLIFDISRAEVSGGGANTFNAGTAEDFVKTRKTVKSTTTVSFLGRFNQAGVDSDAYVRLGNNMASNKYLSSAVKKVSGGSKLSDLSAQERGALRSTVGGEDASIVRTVNAFNAESKAGRITTSVVEGEASALTNVYKQAVGAAYESVSARLGESFDEDTASSAVSGMKKLSQEEWDSLLAFAVKGGSSIESMEDFSKAIGGNSRLAGIFKKAGITSLDQQYETFLALSGTTLYNKEARMLGMAGDVTKSTGRLEVSKGILNSKNQLDSIKFSSLSSGKGASRFSAGTLRAEQLGLSDDLTRMGQASSAARMSGGIDFSGFEMAVGKQMEAASTMEKAGLYMLASSKVGQAVLGQLSSDPAMEKAINSAGLSEVAKRNR